VPSPSNTLEELNDQHDPASAHTINLISEALLAVDTVQKTFPLTSPEAMAAS
jgi:hypothetical protein